MTLTTDMVHGGIDLSDLLLRNTEETTGCQSNHPWTITINDSLSPETSNADAEDFLEVLLAGSAPSSAKSSPLWSPCTTDSGIYEDHLTDPSESHLHPASSTAFPALNAQSVPQPPPPQNQKQPQNEKTSYVSIDIGWESGDLQEQFGIAYYLTTNKTSPLSTTQTLTVKDLLLSNMGQQQIPQHSLHELILNEDEKKLLAKEGVNLPSKLPLSKNEDRVLKKIRRKIRNKHSAQESRKKRREYVDSLEGRMSACSANNLELQKKIQRLEETNNALLEQLNRLQALLPNIPIKTSHRGTCILVLLLSFSLLISSSIQPEPYSQLGREEYTQSKVPSRSLQSLEEALPLPSLLRGFEDLHSLRKKP